MVAGYGTDDVEQGDTEGEGDFLTFDQFVFLESLLPQYTEVDRVVEYVEPGIEAGVAVDRIEGAMQARGASLFRVRTLVRVDGVPRMFVELDLPTAGTITCDTLSAQRRRDRGRGKCERRP